MPVAGCQRNAVPVLANSPQAALAWHNASATAAFLDNDMRMPEIGRSVIHTEGVQLIADWINAMERNACLDF